MPKRIALLFDGTWNTPDQMEGGVRAPTNVSKLNHRIPKSDEQMKWYDDGVGHTWQQRIRGGIAGFGLSRNILQGYVKLIENWQEGDQIFLFGFSRGAYTARSLAGLLRCCWLPHENDKRIVADAYRYYRQRLGPDADHIKAFRESHCRPVDVHFLGVWDTVGALGIPGGMFKWLNEKMWGFHDAQLSRIVKNAYHAVAIDEHRPQYQASLWDDKAKPGQTMEQRWFIGAHANVGGGYADPRLSEIALEWMVERARDCGLRIVERKTPMPDKAYAGLLRNSYKEFIGPVYRWLHGQHLRPVPIAEYVKTRMTIDESVEQRIQDSRMRYRPNNVMKALWEMSEKEKTER